MKSTLRGLWMMLLVVAVVAMPVGCEWEGGSGTNTSQGAGVTVNFSGVYTPRSGDSVVSGKGIAQLVIYQTGNTLEVWDSNGLSYEGSVGSPGIADPGSGTYNSGATMLQSQVYFTGNGVKFIGIIRAVAVVDVEGTSTTEQTVDQTLDGDIDSTQTQTANVSSSGTGNTTASSSGTGSSTTSSSTTTTTGSQSTNQTQTVTIDEGEVSISTTATKNNSTSTSDTSTTSDTATTAATTSSGTSSGSGTASQSLADSQTTSATSTKTGSASVTTKTYIVDEGTAHYVLEGNWSQSGAVSTVSGIAVAVSGTFSVLWDVDTSTVASSQDVLNSSDIGSIDATPDTSTTSSSTLDANAAAQAAQSQAGGGTGGSGSTTEETGLDTATDTAQ